MELTNKAMYIKGLADGLGLDAASKEGKVIAALLELVNEMAGTIEEMQSKMHDLEDYVEELDEDLGDVEEVLVGDGDEDEDEDEDDECCCGDEDEDDFFEAECPNCKEPLVIDEDVLRAGVIECPSCHSQFAVSDECDCDDDDCDCGCGCDHDDE